MDKLDITLTLLLMIIIGIFVFFGYRAYKRGRGK